MMFKRRRFDHKTVKNVVMLLMLAWLQKVNIPCGLDRMGVLTGPGVSGL